MFGGKAEALKSKALQWISRHIAGKSPAYMPVNKVGGNAPTLERIPERASRFSDKMRVNTKC
ncbi:hypothetical protein CQ054_05145 [Ochrobactrum sp. MYb29]|jgi:hypothetical protein|nr:hypothetical protein CQ054_05145 [Ochrobactrum sp. MYb29]